MAAVLGGCTSESRLDSGSAVVSFAVNLKDASRASSERDGNAAHVNRCVLQIWKGEEIYRTVVETAPAGDGFFHFKRILLEPGETYDYLFWADCGTADGGDKYYSTTSLKNVRMLDASIGNDDAMDAFCNRLAGCKVDNDYEMTLTLYRPLAQLNVIVDDYSGIAGFQVQNEFRPVDVSYSYRGCTAFNVLTNKSVGDAVMIDVKDVPVFDGVAASDSLKIVMAYLFPFNGESVSAVDLTIRNANGSTTSSHFDNIPFKQNYRTNIRGRLMTVSGSFSIIVEPLFDGEIDYGSARF